MRPSCDLAAGAVDGPRRPIHVAPMSRSTWIAIGTCMGAAIGAGMGNVPAGIGIGLTMGIALSMVGRDGDGGDCA